MNVDRALQQLTAADSTPRTGAEFVRYVGGRREAIEILGGFSGGRPPQRRDYSTEAEYKAEHTRYRNVRRNVERWDKAPGTGQTRGQTRVSLTAGQRAEARDENRARKLSAVRRRGIRATVMARIIIDSPGKGGRDSRRREISDGGHGILIEDGTAILDAIQAGDLDEAQALLVEGFLDAVPLPAYTELHEAEWTLHPA